jgi:hypothetical protein
VSNRTCSHLPATVIIESYSDGADEVSQAIVIRGCGCISRNCYSTADSMRAPGCHPNCQGAARRHVGATRALPAGTGAELDRGFRWASGGEPDRMGQPDRSSRSAAPVSVDTMRRVAAAHGEDHFQGRHKVTAADFAPHRRRTCSGTGSSRRSSRAVADCWSSPPDRMRAPAVENQVVIPLVHRETAGVPACAETISVRCCVGVKVRAATHLGGGDHARIPDR